MTCPNCGKEVPESAKVCGYCGHRLKNVQISVLPAAIQKEQVPKRKRWGWNVFGIGGILCVIITIIIAVFIFPPSQVVHPTATSVPAIFPTSTSQLTNSPTASSSSWPLLSQGSQGAEVLVLQSMLDYHGYEIVIDGDFGPQTHSAVTSFQQSKGLSANGYVTEATWKAVLVQLTQGMQNSPVYGLQYILNEKFGYSIDLDGDFGPLTRAALDSFQEQHPTADHDGTVGLSTWEALLSKSE